LQPALTIHAGIFAGHTTAILLSKRTFVISYWDISLQVISEFHLKYLVLLVGMHILFDNSEMMTILKERPLG
jgi:hypothetical protein